MLSFGLITEVILPNWDLYQIQIRMSGIKPTLTIHIVADNPEQYAKDLELTLRQLIVSSIDREQAGYRYHRAMMLFPIWLELNPPKRMLKLMKKILKDHRKDAQDNVSKMLKMLKVEGKIRRMEKELPPK